MLIIETMAKLTVIVAATLVLACGAVASEPIHMVSYADISDYPQLASRGVNTLLVELRPDKADWIAAYDAASKSKLKLIPLIWGEDQTIWAWNQKAGEWELNDVRYPESRGAAFLRFLKDNPKYLSHTFALYSFHEPLAQPDRTGPERLRAFYRQITEEEFPKGNLLVYGEDMTMGWTGSDECLTGALDYESHGVYPFCQSPGGRYRPFDYVAGQLGPATDDLQAVLKKEVAALDARLKRYADAKPAATGRRPQPILLIQAYSSKQGKEMWNRMPSSEELTTVAQYLVSKRKDKIAGLSWYTFRNPSVDYTEVLSSHRFDEFKADRWAVINMVGEALRKE